MESNGRVCARPFNELHVGEIGKKPLSSERVAIEERLIFVRFQLQQKRPSGKGLHEAFLVRFRDRDICLAEDDAVALDRFHPVDLNDIRAVYPHETVRRQRLLDRFHARLRHEAASLGRMDADLSLIHI